MKNNQLSTANIFFSLAIILGAVLRFANLGAAPLSDSEASLALQALQLAHGSGQALQPIGQQPGYAILTNWLFFMFGSSNFLARFWPALAGSLLVAFPWLLSTTAWGQRIRRPAWLFMAFGLALAPGLIAASRLATGPMIAMAFMLLTLALILIKQPILAGITAGLALLGGPAILNGLLILGLSWLFTNLLLRTKSEELETAEANQDLKMLRLTGRQIAEFAIATGITIVIVGSSFLRFPTGMATWFETVPTYLQGWVISSGIPVLRLLGALVAFQPIAIIFGTIGAVHGFFSDKLPEERALISVSLAWILAGLVIILIHPSRQVSDLIWIIVPFITLASWELSHYLPEGKLNPISIVQAGVLIMLMGLLWFSLAGLSRIPVGSDARLARWIVVIGVIAFAGLTTVLIQLGWSWQIARYGLVWGVLGGLVLYSVSMLWGAAYVRPNQPQELWAPTPAVGQASLLVSTLEDLSWRNTGMPNSLDIVSEIETPSMHWLLRNFNNARFAEQLETSEMPSILITSQEQQNPELLVTYRGQDFVWSIYPGWNGALPEDLVGWFTFHRAPLLESNVILWARSDLFPGGVLARPEGAAPPQTSDQDLLDYLNQP